VRSPIRRHRVLRWPVIIIWPAGSPLAQTVKILLVDAAFLNQDPDLGRAEGPIVAGPKLFFEAVHVRRAVNLDVDLYLRWPW
jgi:hypothetical protein